MSKTKNIIEAKLFELCDIYGFDDPIELCEAYFCESICPGICTNADCDCTYDYEPDQDAGYCEECKSNSVVSAMVLLGVI